MKWNVVLAGEYPAGTLQKVQSALPAEQFSVRAAGTPEEYKRCTDADFMILRIFKAWEEDIRRNPNLKMISRWGAGYDSVDIKAAGEQNVLVTNTPGANAFAVAQLTILMMLAVGRKLLSHTQCLKDGEWSKNKFLDSSYTLIGKRVGIVGGGNIGRQVARLANAFGAVVQYYDPFPMPDETERQYSMRYVAMDELIRTSDIITLHLPLTKQNRHMIGKNEIDAMKLGAILINVSRGGLVDEAALLEAVSSGHLGGAGIDCVENEPLSADDPLLKNPNIIITPHIGGGTADLADAIIPMLADSITALAAKREVPYVVNREYLRKDAPV